MASKSATKKMWTFMVYLAGDNNLDQNGVKDLAEMKAVGSSAAINILAQFDRAGQKGETKRYFLRKGGALAADAVMKLGETNTGDPKALLDFIQWGIKKYPAERYAVVLWNHGQGWDDTDVYANERARAVHRLAHGRIRHAFFFSSVRTALAGTGKGGTSRAILLDDNAKDFLDNQEMKKVLADVKKTLGRKLDLLGMDACLMSMAEVAYQMRASVWYTVGSEQTEPLEGWPYNTILDTLAKRPALNAQELGAVIVDRYLASYPANEGVTQSACDLARSDTLATAVAGLAKRLADKLGDSAVRQAITQARMQVQTYDVPENIDLVDFCMLLKQKPGLGNDLTTACQQVIDAIQGDTGIVTRSGCKGAQMKNSHGLAIYFPETGVSPLYANLDFVKKTGWGAFLNQYITATRRR